MDPELKENVKNANHWIRGLFILLFVLILGVAKVVTGAVVLFQFVFTLVTGDTNKRLLGLGANLATFINQVILYLTYNTDVKPFPYDEWPGQAAPAVTPRKKTAKKKSAAKAKPADDQTPPATGQD